MRQQPPQQLPASAGTWGRFPMYPLAALIIGLCLSALAFSTIVFSDANGAEERFRNASLLRTLAIERSVSRLNETMRSLSAFFAASEEVTPEEFARFAASIAASGDQGIIALGWASHTPGSAVAGPRAGPPVHRLEYLQSRQRLPGLQVGIDLGAIPPVAEALSRALGGERVATSAPLSQWAPRPEQPASVFAVMTAGVGSSGVVGIGFALVAVHELIESALSLFELEQGSVQVLVADVDAAEAGQTLYRHGSAEAPAAREPGSGVALRSTGLIDVGGRAWRVSTLPGEGQYQGSVGPAAWLVLAAGVLLSLLLAVLIQVLSRQAQRAEALIRARTADLLEAREHEQDRVRQLSALVGELHDARLQLDREARERTQLLEAIPSILIGVDREMCIRQWNRGAERAFELSRDAVLGRPLDCEAIAWEGLIVSDAVSSCMSRLETIRLDQLEFFHQDGATGLLGATLTPLLDECGDVSGCLIIAADVTARIEAEAQRNRMEAELNRAQKLESIGQLAAGIAHEINTPTQYVGDNARFLKDAFKDLFELEGTYARVFEEARGALPEQAIDEIAGAIKAADRDFLAEEIPVAVGQLLDGVERIAHIVRAMKEFSHPGAEGEREFIDLNRATENAITVSSNEWKYVAKIETEFDPDLPAVPCYPQELNQVVLNLIVNAAHAIADVNGKDSGTNGTIVVGTSQVGDEVQIRISDTGSGIPEEIRERVFDPFFTTKEVGKGTGQGLAIAHSIIVDKHGGSLRFDTEPGKGTTFYIRLPLRAEDADSEEAA